MKVLVINPNTSTEMTQTIRVMAEEYRGPLEVDVVNVDYGPEFVDSELDDAVAAVAVVEKVWALQEAYDGFVIACFDDPGLQAARCVTSKPVVGIAQAASTFATAIGGPTGVLVSHSSVIQRATTILEAAGLQPEHLRFVSLDSDIASLSLDHERYREDFMTAADDAVSAGARSIVLACAGFNIYAKELASRSGVPVLDGTACALLLINNLLQLRSGLLWQPPIGKPVTQFKGTRSAQPGWASS